jgi:hypothetical protein
VFPLLLLAIGMVVVNAQTMQINQPTPMMAQPIKPGINQGQALPPVGAPMGNSTAAYSQYSKSMEKSDDRYRERYCDSKIARFYYEAEKNDHTISGQLVDFCLGSKAPNYSLKKNVSEKFRSALNKNFMQPKHYYLPIISGFVDEFAKVVQSTNSKKMNDIVASSIYSMLIKLKTNLFAIESRGVFSYHFYNDYYSKFSPNIRNAGVKAKLDAELAKLLSEHQEIVKVSEKITKQIQAINDFFVQSKRPLKVMANIEPVQLKQAANELSKKMMDMAKDMYWYTHAAATIEHADDKLFGHPSNSVVNPSPNSPAALPANPPMNSSANLPTNLPANSINNLQSAAPAA